MITLDLLPSSLPHGSVDAVDRQHDDQLRTSTVGLIFLARTRGSPDCSRRALRALT